MPEGHTIHRAARTQNKWFKGEVLQMRSPQGRFDDGAKRLSGQKLTKIEANGKHLFYRFTDSGDVLHVHLGLFGKFRTSKPPFPEPSPNARFLAWTDHAELHLAGPTACEVLSEDEMDDIKARLGPDPLVKGTNGADQIHQKLARRSSPIGRALLDQGVIAGLGNVYRAELLFLIGVHPFTPANQVPLKKLSQLWDLSVTELKIGEKSGRIVTVNPAEMGKSSRAKLTRHERLYCYKRQGKPCRRCGDTIVSAEVDSRKIWWCPTHQPSG